MKIKTIETPKLHYDETIFTIVFAKGQGKEVGKLYASLNIDPEKDYTVKIEPVKRKRSLNSNAYYWQLAHQIAETKGIPYTEYHNRNLAEMGVPKLYDGKRLWGLLPDTDWWIHQLDGEDHYGPTSETEDRKGTMYRWFYQLKPSREYDTKEMYSLIDKVVQDAKELGIETMTPDEIARMNAAWGC